MQEIMERESYFCMYQLPLLASLDDNKRILVIPGWRKAERNMLRPSYLVVERRGRDPRGSS